MDIDKSIKFDVRGKIRIGYKVVKAHCSNCKKEVVAIKPVDTFICSDCGQKATPLSGGCNC